MSKLLHMTRTDPLVDVLTIPEIAEALGVCEKTVRRHIAAGKLRARKLGRGVTAPYVITREELARVQNN